MPSTSRRIAIVAASLATLALAATEKPMTMDLISEGYVKLALGMGAHDPDYVDAYYGPPQWRKEADASKKSVAQIRAEAQGLLAALERVAPGASADELSRLRHQYLTKQLQAMVHRTSMLEGTKTSFDVESKALYDAVAPTHPTAYFEGLLKDLDAALPGPGSLTERYSGFRERFHVPPAKVDAVFKAAIAECRRRTLAHMALPSNESFTVEYVTGKSWSAYNWYKGNYQSVIQVNTEFPIEAERAVDLACHEGYPGHHVYNVLLEKTLVQDRKWMEFSVYPLFSPQSLIAEGTANYGIDVAFPGDERMTFERDVVFPLAGLDPRAAPEYRRIQRLFGRLSYAGNEAARQYLEGRIDGAQAAAWLEKYGLSSPDRAKQRVRFMDQYRSYVINYNLGKDLVGAYIESRGGTLENKGKRWEEFTLLLASPRLPGGLAAKR